MDLQTDFNAKLAALLPTGTRNIAVALSGGSDSMALALLAEKWAQSRGANVIALTVDHRLRDESAAEAKQVGKWMKARGIAHEILIHKGKIPKSNIEATAREYRYKLLESYCKKHEIGILAVAHNMDEQAETFFLNLARGSGIFGLAGMPEISERGIVKIVRPLLGFAKDELRSYLKSRRQKWIEDPSNQDKKFKRVRIRNMQKLLAALDMRPERIASTISNMRRARKAIEFYTDELVRQAFRNGIIDPTPMKTVPEEIALRALAKIIQGMTGEAYPPRFESIENLWGKIANGSLGQGMTLAGFKFSTMKNGRIIIAKERGRK